MQTIQIPIENPGKAALMLARAQALFSARVNELANCPKCDQDIRKGLEESREVCNELLRLIKEKASGE